jgi:long-chain acyl-CoA synthetase
VSGATVTELLAASVARSPHADALRSPDPAGGWETVSYAALDRRAERLARGLAAIGVCHGDRVALLCETRAEWTLLDVAIAKAGACSVPLHPQGSRAESEHAVVHAEARAVIAETADHVELARNFAGARERPLVAIDAPQADADSLEALAAHGDAWAGELPPIAPDDRFTILYTSGTTGTPKGCVHTHATYAAALRMTAQIGSIVAGDVSYLWLPLAHVFGREVQSLTLAVGGCVAYFGGDRTRVLDELEQQRPTFFAAVPRIYEKAYDRAVARLAAAGLELDAAAIRHGLAARLDGSEVDAQLEAGPFRLVRELFGGRLREGWIGAGPLARDVLELLFASGVPVYEGYGLTETAAASTIGTAGRLRLGTVGRALPGIDVRVHEGEILLRGPNVFHGYHRDPGATAKVIRDGWLHTGDIGTVDEDGYVRITGRIKDVILTSGGKNVVPGPWEDEVRRSPLVEEVVVLGDRRPYLVALVVPATPGARDCEQGIAACVEAANATRPRWAQVRRFALLERPLSREAGELTATGKVRRPTVAAHRAAQLEALYAG